MNRGVPPTPRAASFVYYIGSARLDHGCFRLEVYKKGGSPIPREASFVYYAGFAGLDHGWFRLEMYKIGDLPSLGSFVLALDTLCWTGPRLGPSGDV